MTINWTAWSGDLVVHIGGVDRSDDLIGAGEIDRELDAAGLATVRLARGTGKPSVGDAISISGLCAIAYQGHVTGVEYDVTARCWVVSASDGLQEVFELAAALAAQVAGAEPDATAATIEAAQAATILALLPAGAIWHRDLHGELRDGWEAAQAAMSTVPYSIYLEGGSLHAVPWAGTGAAATISHAAGGIFDGSVQYTEARAREMVASLSATVEVRYNRWHQWMIECAWGVPDWDFCDWISRPFALPTRQMVFEAVAGNTWSLYASGPVVGQDSLGISTAGLPPSGPQCGSVWNLVGGTTEQGFVWINPLAGTPGESVHSATFSVARRWTQTIVETYHLTVSATSGTPGATLADEQASHDAPSDDTGWDSSPATGPVPGTGWQAPQGGTHPWKDLVDPADRAAVVGGMLQMMATRIRASHRRTAIACTVEPGTEPALGSRAAIVSEDISGTGQVSQLITRWDSDSHAAGCTVRIIITDGSTQDDDLSAPDTPDVSPTAAGYSLDSTLSLGTHVGGLSADEDEDDPEWDGWTCMVQEGNGYPVAGSQEYSTRFALKTPDVPDAARDQQGGAVTYAVTIDPLRAVVTVL